MSSHAATGHIDHHHDHTTTTGIPNKKLLWWAFLASDCMFFGALISTHMVYRLNPPPGNAVPTQVFNIELTSFSTFILLMSSLLMALAVNAIQRGNVKSTRTMLLGTMFFGCIFLGGQVYEFEHFVHAKHMTLSNSIFGSTFYTLTGTNQMKATPKVTQTASRWTKFISRPPPWLPAGLKVRTYIMPSRSTPMATCVPCVPVRVKNVVPSMLFEIVM